MAAGPDGTHIVEPVLDLQLQLLIKLVEQSETNRVPVTLNVPGAVVYGYLVAGAAWRTRWVERMGAMTGEGAKNLSFFPDQILNALDQVLDETGEEKQNPMPRWVHLVDVCMVTGSPNLTNDLPLWRGRLADVAGWSIGFPE